MAISFDVPPEVEAIAAQVRQFVREEVYPREAQLENPSDPGADPAVIEELRELARRAGIFAPQIPQSMGGLGVGMVGMCFINEECGGSILSSLALNTAPPDGGNMSLLLQAATPSQASTYLAPLAAGLTRSGFAMSEPDIASSDALNIETTAVLHGDEWVLNGNKFYVSGARGAAFAVVYARTNLGEVGHRSFSLFLVPLPAPGWTELADVQSTYTRHPGGEPNVVLRDVRVPRDAILGEIGDGFDLVQKRLTRGRLDHAMRWIGRAQRALDLASQRLHFRRAFGSALADKQALQFMIADSAVDLYASRMMVLNAAWRIDSGLAHRHEVSMAKIFVSEMYQRVIDRAVQIYGAHGLMRDELIGQWYNDARASRIIDGTNELHRVIVARSLLRDSVKNGRTWRASGSLLDE